MRIIESCAECLYDKQKNISDDAAYLSKIKELIDNRSETDTSPYMVYLFNKVHTEFFGKGADYTAIKKQYNDLVLGMEDKLREEIEASPDPLAKALIMSRIGNYIDFGAMNHVDEATFLKLFSDTEMREDDIAVYESFLKQCEDARSFLLITDNCGEIVLDKLMLEQLSRRFPEMKLRIMVRGGAVLNDATRDDAEYSGISRIAEVYDNGEAIAGTVPEMLPEEAREVLSSSDVILSKGQGNYESLTGRGIHAFYMFLCKCELFIKRFNVPKLTGIFVEDK